MGAGAVAHHRQPGPDLGAGERRGLVGELHVVEPAQAGQVALVRLGQVVQGVGRRPRAQPLGHLLGLGPPEAAVLEHVLDAGRTGRLGDQPHAVQGPVHRLGRHGDAAIAGLEQEVDRIGAEPGVGLAIARPPQAERPVHALAVEQLDRRVEQGGWGALQLGRARHLLGVEQGIGDGDQLFGAAIGIALQGFGDRRRVEAAERRVGHRHRQLAWRQAGQQVWRGRERLAGLLEGQGGAGDGAPAEAGLQRIADAGVEAGPVHLQRHRADARPVGRGQRDVVQDALAEGELVQLLERRQQAALAKDAGDVCADLALDIVQLQPDVGPVARSHEAGQVELGHHRLAHQHRLLAAADRLIVPGHRHQAQLAVEGAGRQMDGRPAVGPGLDHAGPQSHGLDRGRPQARAADLVAAVVHRRRRPQIGVQQPAVVVAIVHRQGAPAEVPLHRIGRGLVGQAQDAFVHRRDRDMGVGAEGQALDLQRDGDRRTRVELAGRRERDGKDLALGFERHIDQAERAARLGRGARVARLHHADQQIGPAAPFGSSVQAHGGPAGWHADGLELDDPIRRHRHLGLAGEGGIDVQGHRVAGRIGRVADGQPGGVGRVLVLGAVAPAGGLADHGAGAGRGVLQHQAIVAPGKPAGDAGGLTRTDIHRTMDDHGVAAGAMEAPAAVLLEPGIGPVLGDQSVVDRVRDAAALGVHGDDVIALGLFLAETALSDLDPEIDRPHPQLQRQPLSDRTPARLQHRSGDVGAERLHGVGHLGGVQRHAGVPGPIGGGLRQLDQLGFERGLLVAPTEAFELGEGIGVRRNAGLGLGLQARTRRAVEEASVDDELARLARDHRPGGVADDRHRQPLGREVLHLEADLAGGVVGAVHLQGGAPGPARRGAGQDQVLGQRPVRRGVEADAAELGARGPADHQYPLAVLDRAREVVAHQGHQVHRLARPVDAAIGVEIAVHRSRRRMAVRGLGARQDPTGHALELIGQVQRRAAEVEQGEVGVGAIGHDHGRLGRALAVEQGVVEADVALDVARGRGQGLAILGGQGDAHPRHRPGGL